MMSISSNAHLHHVWPKHHPNLAGYTTTSGGADRWKLMSRECFFISRMAASPSLAANTFV